MKKIIGFDLDDTLAITKSPISDRMAGILSRLLENYDVCGDYWRYVSADKEAGD